MLGGATNTFLRDAMEDAFAPSLDHATPLVNGRPPDVIVRGDVQHARSSAAVMLATSGVFAPPAAASATNVSMLGWQPDRINARPKIAAQASGMFAPFMGIPVGAGPSPGELGYQPSRLNARAKIAAGAQFFDIGKPSPPASPTNVAMLGYYPARLNRRERIAARVPFYFAPFPFVSTVPFGPSGPVFVVALEVGASVTMEWSNEVTKTWTGAEQRIAHLGLPRVTIKGSANLVDGDSRDVRSQIVSNAASGATFLLGMPHEEVTIVAPSSGTAANVGSTAMLDWAKPGQRVIAIGDDGTTVTAVVQDKNATQILLDVALGAVGSVGARVMPLLAVFLDAQQGFSRYPVNVEAWAIKARAELFGYAGSEDMGLGATLTTYADSILGQVFYVWDRGLNATDSPPADSVQTLADMVDLGGVPAMAGSAPHPDYGREIRLSSDDVVDWQWIKAMLYALRGNQQAFVVSTGRADLFFDSTVSGTVFKVKKGATYGDVTQFWNVGLARRLSLTMTDGSIQNVAVTAITDNGDGTVSIQVATAIAGTIARISYLEQCRFESDTFEVTFTGAVFNFAATARVVQS